MSKLPIPVFLESPFSGEIERNAIYARHALADSISRGEAPFASHLLYTQVLDDEVLLHRLKGLECADVWRARAEFLVVYEDLGISRGMAAGIAHAKQLGLKILYRRLHNA